MASFRKKGDGWEASICRKGIRTSKTFDTKLEASHWAADTEKEIISGKHGEIPVNQRAKLTRVLGETALKSFHSGLLNNRHLVGELWSVTNGYYCGSKKTAFCQ